ncbi:MAG: hypothetical protein ABIO99_08530 [Candidatus Limnocylindria bacterium]
MKAVFVLVLVLVVVTVGIKMSGGRLPLIDYPLGTVGGPGTGPGVPDIQVEAPGFDDAPVSRLRQAPMRVMSLSASSIE